MIFNIDDVQANDMLRVSGLLRLQSTGDCKFTHRVSVITPGEDRQVLVDQLVQFESEAGGPLRSALPVCVVFRAKSAGHHRFKVEQEVHSGDVSFGSDPEDAPKLERVAR